MKASAGHTRALKAEPVLNITQMGGVSSFPWTMYIDGLIAEGLSCHQSSSWRIDGKSQEIYGKFAKLVEDHRRSFSYADSSGTGLVDLDGGLGWLSITDGGATVATSFRHPNPEGHKAFIREVKKSFPVAKPGDDKKVAVNFWMSGRNGPVEMTRRLETPDWSDIKDNYPGQMSSLLADLMNDFKPARGGQLILWHGPPGTGKTTALRALAYEWRHWCDTEYIVDPEAFFGSAAYMMGVVMGNSNRGGEVAVGDYTAEEELLSDIFTAPHSLAKQGRWRVLVLEDAGELLAEDARSREGQALSRFLNLADGMIGQGLRILALVTTNEPLGKLHPAVGRPGRCAAEVEFRKFTEEEAEEWFGKEQAASAGKLKTRKPTLAELYAAVEGFTGAVGSTKGAIGLKV